MSIEVKIELGHRASLRDKPTAEGFTHDWIVFVRGAEGSNIQHFVDKVVFQLHESFPKPKRVIKEPPYQVAESGYAGFNMPIEVYFRTKEEPKKVRYEYDLYLRLETPPVSNIRLEKLTFQNPSDDFKRKLLKAGGLAISGGGSGIASLQTQALPTQHTEEFPSHPRGIIAEKKPRSHVAAKESSKPPAPPPPAAAPAPPKGSQPFTDIFGVPIKTKTSPDSTTKTKDSAQAKSKISPVAATNSSSSTTTTTTTVSSSTKEAKSTHKEPHSEAKDAKPKLAKSAKPEKEAKGIKRPGNNPVDANDSHGTGDKKKRHVSSSSENGEKPKVKNGKERPKSKAPLKKEKEKLKPKSTPDAGKPIKANSQVSPASSSIESDSSDSKRSVGNKAQYSSPASSISETSLDANRPPSAAMSDIENDALSPLSSGSELSPCSAKHWDAPKTKNDKNSQPQPMKPKPKPLTKSSKGNNGIALNSNNNSESVPPVSTDNDERIAQKENALDRSELMELQQKIMSSNDRQVLQKIVDVIEKTGKFQISNTSFDFDLCTLDHVTVKKLKLCLTT